MDTFKTIPYDDIINFLNFNNIEYDDPYQTAYELIDNLPKSIVNWIIKHKKNLDNHDKLTGIYDIDKKLMLEYIDDYKSLYFTNKYINNLIDQPDILTKIIEKYGLNDQYQGHFKNFKDVLSVLNTENIRIRAFFGYKYFLYEYIEDLNEAQNVYDNYRKYMGSDKRNFGDQSDRSYIQNILIGYIEGLHFNLLLDWIHQIINIKTLDYYDKLQYIGDILRYLIKLGINNTDNIKSHIIQIFKETILPFLIFNNDKKYCFYYGNII